MIKVKPIKETPKLSEMETIKIIKELTPPTEEQINKLKRRCNLIR